MFLSEEEINHLTGYQRPSAQKRWLGKNGYPYAESSTGKPRVLIRLLYAKLGIPVHVEFDEKPDFSALYR